MMLAGLSAGACAQNAKDASVRSIVLTSSPTQIMTATKTSTPIEGHSILSKRPDASCKLLWRVETPSGTHYRWEGQSRLHGSQEDAYDAAGLDPSQAPKEFS